MVYSGGINMRCRYVTDPEIWVKIFEADQQHIKETGWSYFEELPQSETGKEDKDERAR